MDAKRATPLLSFLPLLVGIVIYLLWRPTNLNYHFVSPALWTSLDLENFRSCAAWVRPNVPDWVIYSFPGGAWVFTVTCLMHQIWTGRNSPTYYFWLSVVPLVGVAGELLQLISVLPGTFDVYDLLAYITGFALTFPLKRKLRW